MKEEIRQKVQQLQMFEQNLQSFISQKQQLQSQLLEIESATKEISKTEETFQIIGNLMVKRNKDELSKELAQKKEKLDIQLKSIEKQEDAIKEKAKKIQEDVVEGMK